MDCLDISSSFSSDSSEGCLNVDCSNNLVDGGDVPVEENDCSVMDIEEEGYAKKAEIFRIPISTYFGSRDLPQKIHLGTRVF